MRPILTLAAAAVLLAAPALAEPALIDRPSPHDVATTIDRLEEAVTAAGATVVARVNHGQAAEKAGLDLRPTELLIFGNPMVGTPLMQANQQLGLELPLRAAAYLAADGTVHLVYPDMADLGASYDLPADDPSLAKAAAALEKLTAAAVAEK